MKSFFWTGLCLVLAFTASASAQITASGFNHLTASVSSNGSWSVTAPGPAWQWSGATGAPVSSGRTDTGTDNLGGFQELVFNYAIGASSRSASIRVYSARPLVLFSITYNNTAANVSPFPVFNTY